MGTMVSPFWESLNTLTSDYDGRDQGNDGVVLEVLYAFLLLHVLPLVSHLGRDRLADLDNVGGPGTRVSSSFFWMRMAQNSWRCDCWKGGKVLLQTGFILLVASCGLDLEDANLPALNKYFINNHKISSHFTRITEVVNIPPFSKLPDSTEKQQMWEKWTV